MQEFKRLAAEVHKCVGTAETSIEELRPIAEMDHEPTGIAPSLAKERIQVGTSAGGGGGGRIAQAVCLRIGG